jgi:hypothetical protein
MFLFTTDDSLDRPSYNDSIPTSVYSAYMGQDLSNGKRNFLPEKSLRLCLFTALRKISLQIDPLSGQRIQKSMAKNY